MNKIVLWAVCGCLISSVLCAQPGNSQEQPSSNISTVIAQIAKNNKQLQAYQHYMESRELVNQTTNNLNDLQLSGAYLPFGNHSSGHYMEVQVSQSFELPAAYRARSEFNRQARTQDEIAYLKDRQQIMLQASDLYTELVYQQKKKETRLIRTEQARQVRDQIQELFNKEQIGKIELNKAKITWLQQQFSVEVIDAEINELLTGLNGLNGGLDIELDLSANANYMGGLVMANLDSLWTDKKATDPALLFRNEREQTALAHIAVQKKERLPQFDLGLNYEGVRGEYFGGFSGGLSIPIWNRKNTVKAAEAQYLYEQKQSDALSSALFSEYSNLYQHYSHLLEQFYLYSSSLDGLDGEALLAKAYDLGEISYLEYYMELQFYQDAYDTMLEMERELFLLKNKLLKHKL